MSRRANQRRDCWIGTLSNVGRLRKRSWQDTQLTAPPGGLTSVGSKLFGRNRVDRLRLRCSSYGIRTGWARRIPDCDDRPSDQKTQFSFSRITLSLSRIWEDKKTRRTGGSSTGNTVSCRVTAYVSTRGSWRASCTRAPLLRSGLEPLQRGHRGLRAELLGSAAAVDRPPTDTGRVRYGAGGDSQVAHVDAYSLS